MPGNPPDTGYSQSKSMPSKLNLRRKSTAELANVSRVTWLAATSLKRFDQVHPPTEMIVFRCGFACFSLFS
ncbi:hypothetical protein D3C76_458560 [compost metagenome]